MAGTAKARRNPMAWVALAVAIGVWVGRHTSGGLWLALPVLLSAGIWAALRARLKSQESQVWGLSRVCMTAFALGCLSGWNYYHSFAASHVVHLTEVSTYAKITGRVASIPERVLSNVELAHRNPRRARWNMRFVLECEEISLEGDTPQACSGQVLVTVRMLPPERVHAGQKVRVEGIFSRPRPALNPGGFDARSYLANKKIHRELRSDKHAFQELSSAHRGDLLSIANSLRNYMRQALTLGVEDDPFASSLLAGKLYGDREGFSPEWNEYFRRSGTMHLFAVSGQNIGVLLAVGVVIFWLGGLNRWQWAGLLILPLGTYALATGGQPSAIRAFVMGGLLLAAWRFDRPVKALNLLGSACAIILLVDPAQLYDAGFQLSVGVVFSLIALTGTLYHKMASLFEPDEFFPEELWGWWMRFRVLFFRFLSGLISATLAAFVGSLPLTYFHFNLLSWASLPANFIVVPVAAIIVFLGAGSILTGWLLPWVALGLNNVSWVLVGVIAWGAAYFGKLPGGSFYLSHPAQWENPIPRLVVLSAGSNLSILAISQNGIDLVGGGNDFTMESVTMPALRYYGANRIARHILPAGTAETAGGALTLRKYLPVEGYYLNPLPNRALSLRRLQKEENFVFKNLWAGAELGSAHLLMQVCWPSSFEAYSGLTNRSGAILRWSLPGAGRVLLVPNPNFEVLEGIAKESQDLESEFLILSGPNSLERLPDEFLLAVAPKHVIVSTGGYRHSKISPLFISQMQRLGAEFWDLDSTGALEISGRSGTRPLKLMRALNPDPHLH